MKQFISIVDLQYIPRAIERVQKSSHNPRWLTPDDDPVKFIIGAYVTTQPSRVAVLTENGTFMVDVIADTCALMTDDEFDSEILEL